MKRIDELLEKYFAGNSSLHDEKELKNYFSGKSVDSEHLKYIPLFQSFEIEKEIKLPTKEIKIIKNNSLRQRIIFISCGVAAACLFLVFVFRYQNQDSNENYMIVHGKRINNSEMAQNFANSKIEKSLNVIHKSLASYKDNKEIQEKLQEIEYQIKLKK